MPKSTRGARFGRADVIEVFSPRRSGPWHLLRPLHSKIGLLVVGLLTLGIVVHFTTTGQPALALLTVLIAVALELLSFPLMWELVGLLIRSRAELTLAAIVTPVVLVLRHMMPAV